MRQSAVEIVKKIAKSEDRALAYEFFLCFSRFEYALKRTGYVKANQQNEANVYWQKFAQVKDSLILTVQDDRFCSAVAYIMENPPKKQVVYNEILGWEDDSFSGKFDLDRVLVLVRRIRNNLFHGGKFPEGPEHDISRDRRLRESSLVILQTCIESDDKVMRFFLEDID